jgi:hypothetical protein
MRRAAPILFAVVLAMLIRPLQLPAASCILLNAPSEQRCKMHCCANKTCCAKSKGSNAPASQPLHQSEIAKQQQVIGFVSVELTNAIAMEFLPRPACHYVPPRLHSPPPLAVSCIRLI